MSKEDTAINLWLRPEVAEACWRVTSAVKGVLDSPGQDHGGLLAAGLHVDAGGHRLEAGGQIGLLAEAVALADALLEVQALRGVQLHITCGVVSM